MPPKTQKRSKVTSRPNGTLHDFFVPQLQASANSRKATSSIVKEQIILIESDSDGSIEIVENTVLKRRKLAPKNDNPNGLKEKDLLQATDQKKSPLPNVAKSVEASHMNRISFGKPFLLCPTSMDDTSTDPNSNCDSRHFPNSSTSLLVTTGNKQFSSKPDKDLTLDDWNNSEVLADPVMKEEKFSGTDASTTRELEGDFTADDEWSSALIDEEIDQAVDDFFPPPVSDQKSANAKTSNAFSVLMSSLKEKEAWKEADIAEDKTLRTHPSYARRKAPFYKILQGMPIAVDAFRYGAIPGVNAYFLSHAHSDHYTTLSSSWKNGPIYCSKATANLITHMLNVDKKWVRPLPMDTPVLVPDTNGVTVTLIEANHCPGSCLFFFEGPQTVNSGDSNFKSAYIGSSRIFRYLHCGDFRASPQHILHHALRGKTVDHVYLDTTYLDPRYTFPPQPLVISACAELARKLIQGEHTTKQSSSMLSWLNPISVKGKEKEQARTLIVVGTYTIGKERIVKAIAHAVNSKVYCDERKSGFLKCEEDPELDALLTSNPNDSIVHLVPLHTISTDRMKIYLERFQGIYDKVIGFRPTGWTYNQPAGADLSPSVVAILNKASEQNFSYLDLRISQNSTPTLQVYPVPYSEHSSFSELTCFAMSFTWVKIIATVNVGNESSRAKMAKWIAKWEAERKKRGKDVIVPHRHPDYW